jgi:hypothetical protein
MDKNIPFMYDMVNVWYYHSNAKNPFVYTIRCFMNLWDIPLNDSIDFIMAVIQD